MEESVYVSLADPYFAALCDSRISDDSEALQLNVESYSKLLTRLELQFNAQTADISAAEKSAQDINDRVKTLQAEVENQREAIQQANAAQKRYEHFQNMLSHKFSKPVELMINSDRKNNDETSSAMSFARNNQPRKITTTLNESVEQLETKQETLAASIAEVEAEMEEDLIDFNDRLQDLNHILALLNDFDHKYCSPRGPRRKPGITGDQKVANDNPRLHHGHSETAQNIPHVDSFSVEDSNTRKPASTDAGNANANRDDDCNDEARRNEDIEDYNDEYDGNDDDDDVNDDDVNDADVNDNDVNDDDDNNDDDQDDGYDPSDYN